MTAINDKSIAAAAHEKAIDDAATRVQHDGTKGCKILEELHGMEIKDIKAVLAGAQQKQNAEFAKTGSLPFVEFNVAPYSERLSGYGYAPDSYREQAMIKINALVPGAKNGMENIVTYDTTVAAPYQNQPGWNTCANK